MCGSAGPTTDPASGFVNPQARIDIELWISETRVWVISSRQSVDNDREISQRRGTPVEHARQRGSISTDLADSPNHSD